MDTPCIHLVSVCCALHNYTSHPGNRGCNYGRSSRSLLIHLFPTPLHSKFSVPPPDLIEEYDQQRASDTISREIPLTRGYLNELIPITIHLEFEENDRINSLLKRIESAHK